MSRNPRLKDKYGMVTSNVMRDPAVSVPCKGLYALLATYADPRTNVTNVSVVRLASELAVTESTIKRCLKTLLIQGIVSRRKDASSKTTYTMLLK